MSAKTARRTLYLTLIISPSSTAVFVQIIGKTIWRLSSIGIEIFAFSIHHVHADPMATGKMFRVRVADHYASVRWCLRKVIGAEDAYKRGSTIGQGSLYFLRIHDAKSNSTFLLRSTSMTFSNSAYATTVRDACRAPTNLITKRTLPSRDKLK